MYSMSKVIVFLSSLSVDPSKFLFHFEGSEAGTKKELKAQETDRDIERKKWREKWHYI